MRRNDNKKGSFILLLLLIFLVLLSALLLVLDEADSGKSGARDMRFAATAIERTQHAIKLRCKAHLSPEGR